MSDRLQAVKGMNDVLPADEPLWRRFEESVAETMRAYGYRRIRTPIVEHTQLFTRGIGEVTLQTLHRAARAENSSLFAAARRLAETDEISGPARRALKDLG